MIAASPSDFMMVRTLSRNDGPACHSRSAISGGQHRYPGAVVTRGEFRVDGHLWQLVGCASVFRRMCVSLACPFHDAELAPAPVRPARVLMHMFCFSSAVGSIGFRTLCSPTALSHESPSASSAASLGLTAPSITVLSFGRLTLATCSPCVLLSIHPPELVKCMSLPLSVMRRTPTCSLVASVIARRPGSWLACSCPLWLNVTFLPDPRVLSLCHSPRLTSSARPRR